MVLAPSLELAGARLSSDDFPVHVLGWIPDNGGHLVQAGNVTGQPDCESA